MKIVNCLLADANQPIEAQLACEGKDSRTLWPRETILGILIHVSTIVDKLPMYVQISSLNIYILYI